MDLTLFGILGRGQDLGLRRRRKDRTSKFLRAVSKGPTLHHSFPRRRNPPDKTRPLKEVGFRDPVPAVGTLTPALFFRFWPRPKCPSSRCLKSSLYAPRLSGIKGSRPFPSTPRGSPPLLPWRSAAGTGPSTPCRNPPLRRVYTRSHTEIASVERTGEVAPSRRSRGARLSPTPQGMVSHTDHKPINLERGSKTVIDRRRVRRKALINLILAQKGPEKAEGGLRLDRSSGSDDPVQGVPSALGGLGKPLDVRSRMRIGSEVVPVSTRPRPVKRAKPCRQERSQRNFRSPPPPPESWLGSSDSATGERTGVRLRPPVLPECIKKGRGNPCRALTLTPVTPKERREVERVKG